MKYRLLVSGGSSEIGMEVIRRIRIRDDIDIYATTHTGTLTELLSEDKVFSLDNTDSTAFNSYLAEISELNFTHYIQLHGFADKKESLDNFDVLRYQEIMNVNLESTIKTVAAILPGMQRKKFGRMVFTSTASATHGGGYDSFVYGLTKHALVYLTEHIGKHYTRDDILANCIMPGFIDTRFHKRYMDRDVTRLSERASSVPLGRAGTAEEVAKCIETLILDNTFISGQAITIDGGDFI